MSFNEEQVFGKGWFWENSDFILDNSGNVKLSTGRERAVHGIQVLLLTQKSEDFFHPATGFDFISIAQNESHFSAGEQIEFAKMLIRQALRQDDRVKFVSSVEFNEEETISRNKVFDVIVTLFNDERITIQMAVQV